MGDDGQGESVWLAWFLCDVLERFAEICEQQGDADTAERLPGRGAKEYAAAVEESAWDGDWYRRAYYDDGTPLGSNQIAECQIDAIAQSWAVLSGAGDPERAGRPCSRCSNGWCARRTGCPAVHAALRQDPARPGLYQRLSARHPRERRAVYPRRHLDRLGLCQPGRWPAGRGAVRPAQPHLPFRHAGKAAVYRVEPYVVCADVYSVPPYVRRGGWTWYTGSAAWMYRLGIEAILGFQKGGHLAHRPGHPARLGWLRDPYRWRATYQIRAQPRPRRPRRAPGDAGWDSLADR